MCIISQNGPAIGNVLIDARLVQYRLLVSPVRRLRAKLAKILTRYLVTPSSVLFLQFYNVQSRPGLLRVHDLY